jgi:hypothetical protein
MPEQEQKPSLARDKQAIFQKYVEYKKRLEVEDEQARASAWMEFFTDSLFEPTTAVAYAMMLCLELTSYYEEPVFGNLSKLILEWTKEYEPEAYAKAMEHQNEKNTTQNQGS